MGLHQVSQFYYEREVRVDSDHKPIEAIMRRGVVEVHSPRLQVLQYNLKVCYKPKKELHIADMLSGDYLKKIITETVHTISMTNEK